MFACKECDGTSFICIGGKYYCSACNLQISDIHEQYSEDAYNLGHSQKFSNQTSSLKDIAPKFCIGFTSTPNIGPNPRFRDILQCDHWSTKSIFRQLADSLNNQDTADNSTDQGSTIKMTDFGLNIENTEKTSENGELKLENFVGNGLSAILDKYVEEISFEPKDECSNKRKPYSEENKKQTHKKHKNDRHQSLETLIRPGLDAKTVEAYLLKNIPRRYTNKCLNKYSIKERNQNYVHRFKSKPIIEDNKPPKSKDSNNYAKGSLRTGCLTLLSTLGFTYLGAFLCSSPNSSNVNRPILLSDIIRLVNSGSLPFFVNSFQVLPENMRFSMFDTCVLNTRTLPLSRSIRINCAKLISAMGWHQNLHFDSNFEDSSNLYLSVLRPMIDRILSRLELPGSVKIIAHTLLDSFKMSNGTKTSLHLKGEDAVPVLELFTLEDPPYNKFKGAKYWFNWEGQAWALVLVSFKIFLATFYSSHTSSRSQNNYNPNFNDSLEVNFNPEFRTWLDKFYEGCERKYDQHFSIDYTKRPNELNPSLITSPKSNVVLESLLDKYAVGIVENADPDKLASIMTCSNTMHRAKTRLMLQPDLINASDITERTNECLNAARFSAYRPNPDNNPSSLKSRLVKTFEALLDNRNLDDYSESRETKNFKIKNDLESKATKKIETDPLLIYMSSQWKYITVKSDSNLLEEISIRNILDFTNKKSIGGTKTEFKKLVKKMLSSGDTNVNKRNENGTHLKLPHWWHDFNQMLRLSIKLSYQTLEELLHQICSLEIRLKYNFA
ncbi:unnamed protein product [Gordionus sp. m RMFG-2023]|uniref:uncharacterized protein LOC135929185 isoform X2 n=1 Tax=Gordionus sp. m RMFG-2023 TaxID=3053472 RepID=UPI0030E2018E